MNAQTRRAGTLRVLAGCLAFLAALFALRPAAALPFHVAYGRIDDFGGLTSVTPTQGPGAIATGYFGFGFTQGMLLKVQPTGTLSWVQAYGSTLLTTVRETAAGTFVVTGIGSLGLPPRTAPVVAEVDATGTVLWARAIDLPSPDGTPGDQAYGRFLEIDPRDGGYWVGGERWRRAFVNSEPWLAKLDRSGNLLWAKVVSFPESARFLSLFPALDGGVIGVGQIWLEDDRGALQSRMLAVKLRADGTYEWGFRYLVQNADLRQSWQWLADLDRDPLSDRQESAVVGTVTGFCKSVPSVPCDPVRSAAFVATLDESTGMLAGSAGLFSLVQPETLGETIVMDQLQEVYAVGGEIEGDERGSREGLLTFLNLGTSFPRSAMLYGDGAGLFDADLGSLARCRNEPDPGYLFLMNEIDWTAPALSAKRDLVRTNSAGRSGACEGKTVVATFQAIVDRFAVQPVLRNGKLAEIPLAASPVSLPEEPCRACPREQSARTEPSRTPEAKAMVATVLPGIPGAPEGRRGSAPMRIPPLRPGARLAGLAGRAGESLTFYLDVTEGTARLQVRTTGGEGNADLRVERGVPAAAGETARVSAGPGNQEEVRLSQPAPGLWTVTLVGTADFEGLTLSVEK
jgi:hypothetical protein